MFKSSFLVVRRLVEASKIHRSKFHININAAFGKYLFVTNTVSSGVLLLAGDLLQQEVEFRQKKLEKRYDLQRLTKMFIVGLGAGPLHHYFYLYLHKMLPHRNLVSITKKILLDQFVMSPVCIGYFFYGAGLFELKSVSQMNHEIKNKFQEVYLMDWCIWPPTQFINFYFIKVKYQVFYINAVTMFYDMFLSYVKHRKEDVYVKDEEKLIHVA